MQIRSTTAAIFTGVFLLCAAPMAHAAGGSPQNFEQRKSEQLHRIDTRITHLQEERSCIQASSTQDGIKNCRERFRTVKPRAK
jgi:hypothetical protein